MVEVATALPVALVNVVVAWRLLEGLVDLLFGEELHFEEQSQLADSVVVQSLLGDQRRDEGLEPDLGPAANDVDSSD